MTRHLPTILLITFALTGCAPPDGAMGTDDEDLQCRTCGGDGDPPPVIYATCYRDADHDGLGAGLPAKMLNSCSAGWVKNKSDCNDADAAVTYGNPCYRDADGDGFGNPSSSVYACGACPAGYVSNASDCNDGSAVTHPQTCQVDNDGDGYSADGTLCVASCPSTVYWGGGDCNDANPGIHPEKFEGIENGLDDNCNGLTDESEFNWGDPANYTTATVTLDFALESKLAASTARKGLPLFAVVRYAPLTNTADVHSLNMAVTTLPPPDGAPSPRGRIVVGPLAAETAYRFEVLLFTDAQRTQSIVAGNGQWGEVSSTAFYGMTLSPSADRVTQTRPLLFQRVFIEWNSSQTGQVRGGNPYCPGYNCDRQHGGEEWCSEFYGWAISLYYRDIQTYYHLYTGDIIRAFSNAGTWTDVNGNLAIFLAQGYFHVGDYLGIGEPGNLHHSAMFLAYDQSTGKIWQLSGNANNRVGFGESVLSDVQGYGMLNASMLK